MNIPNCHLCHQPLRLARRPRHEFSTMSYCDACHYSYYLTDHEGKQNYHIQNIQRRFSHNNTCWHMTYRPADDETTFGIVERRKDNLIFSSIKDGEIPITTKRYKLPTFVSSERFISMVAFL